MNTDSLFAAQIAAALEESRRTAEAEAKRRVGKGGVPVINLPKDRPFDSGLFAEAVKGGFSKLFKNPLMSDIVLLVGEEKIPAHRLVLCTWSDTLRAKLEADSGAKELKIDDAHFMLLLEYMYTGNTAFVDDDNVIPIIALSHQYGVHALKEACGKLLGEQLSEENIFYLLDIVDKYDCKEFQKKCGEFLATNFEALWDEGPQQLLSLSLDAWAAMLASDELRIYSEKKLCDIILNYVNNRFEDKEQREVALNKLLPHVRFAALSAQQLVELFEGDEKLNQLPIVHSMLYQAFRYLACPSVPPTFNVNRRSGFLKFDPEQKGPNLALSDEDTTVTSSHSGWQSVRMATPFDDSNVYVEFNCKVLTNVMLGVVVGTCACASGYAGQYQNGYVVHNTNGMLHYSGQNMAKGAIFATGDKIGLSYSMATGLLTFWKNKVQLFTHPVGVHSNVYPIISFVNSNTISIVQWPEIPLGVVRTKKAAASGTKLPRKIQVVKVEKEEDEDYDRPGAKKRKATAPREKKRGRGGGGGGNEKKKSISVNTRAQQTPFNFGGGSGSKQTTPTFSSFRAIEEEDYDSDHSDDDY